MKIMRFIDGDGQARLGQPQGPDHASLLDGDLFGQLTPTDRMVRIDKVLAPIDPPNILAIGLNYRKHAKETNAPLPTAPVIFIKATTALIGPGEPIVLPNAAPDEVDYEAELAIVIGRRARDVSEADAFDHVLGFTCANDVSARDCQMRHDVQWARAKSFDTFCPLGPVLVTLDEIDPDRVAIRSILNGQVMQDSNTNDLIFTCRHVVSYLSHQFTLLPGTVIITGTPSGVGIARDPQVFLRDGDEITIDIEGIGQLTNPVVRG